MVQNNSEIIEIGGYFGLELPSPSDNYRFNNLLHLNSGRNAMEYLLRQLPQKPELVYIPAYTCDAVCTPLDRLKINYKFYRINQEFEIPIIPNLKENEYIVVNNYFGIKDNYVNHLATKLGDHIIIDNAQALYSPVPDNIKGFYSPRKFVGVPDGGLATFYSKDNIYLDQSESWDRALQLFKRIDCNAASGYDIYQKNEENLGLQETKYMSKLSETMLRSVKHDDVIAKRRHNYEQLHKELANHNKLNLPDSDSFVCPMVYPFWANDSTLRKRLIENKIYVATYWPNVFEWCSPASLEYQFARNLIPLPIDQRYTTNDLNRIIDTILH